MNISSLSAHSAIRFSRNLMMTPVKLLSRSGPFRKLELRTDSGKCWKRLQLYEPYHVYFHCSLGDGRKETLSVRARIMKFNNVSFFQGFMGSLVLFRQLRIFGKFLI